MQAPLFRKFESGSISGITVTLARIEKWCVNQMGEHRMHTESEIHGMFFVCKRNTAPECDMKPAACGEGKDEC